MAVTVTLVSGKPALRPGCCCSQDWSAYRESSFGHAILDFADANTAQFTWNRNQDPVSGTPADTVSVPLSLGQGFS